MTSERTLPDGLGSRPSVRRKLFWIVAVAVSGIVLQAIVLLSAMRTNMFEDRQAVARDRVAAAVNLLHDFRHRVVTGQLGRQDAQMQALAMLGALSRERASGLWVSDGASRVLLHSTRPDLVGQPAQSLVTRSDGMTTDTQVFEPWDWTLGSEVNTRDLSDTLVREVWIATAIALAIGLAISLTGYRLGLAVARRLHIAGAHAQDISSGVLDRRIEAGEQDEIGRLLAALERMRNDLAVRIEQERRIAAENLRIRTALDFVHTNVRIADARGTVIYANDAMMRTVRRIEPDIRRQVPQFSADRLLECDVSMLCNNPDFVRTREALGRGERSVLHIGPHVFHVITTPVKSPAGEVLGMVAEWTDRTGEVGLQKEVTALVDAASRGDFVSRLEVDGKEGFFRDLSEGLNALVGQVAGSLEDVASVLNAVAGGDLSRKIERDYEGMFGQLKDDTNTTVEKLREVVGRIKEATEAINTAAREISAGNSDLSSRTEEQASSLEETASSMEELNATVRQNAESAQKANALGQSSNDEVMRGAQTVRRVVETMGEIQGSSRKIADIIGVIDSIAFQTNILALNAAVEAARAGEQGRGFAVVASEVRSLAQRSAQAAKEIKGLIADSVERVDGGAKLVEQAGETMERVVESFRQVTGLVTDIALASQEQASGIAQVTQAVSQMDGVTQQNAALVEEAAASAESLEEQARALLKVVGGFRLAAAPVSKRHDAMRRAAANA